jgi:hypothetical protein
VEVDVAMTSSEEPDLSLALEPDTYDLTFDL